MTPGRFRAHTVVTAAIGPALLLVAVTTASLAALLEPAITLTPDEATRLREGESITKRLPTEVSYEVAVAGAVRVRAPLDRFLAVARDVARWKRGPAVLQLGVFHARPVPADVAALTLDQPDLDALARCRRGNCASKLVALAPEEFRRFDWSAPDARARAEALVRAGLLRHVEAYLQRGQDALMVYADDRRTSLPAEFAGLIEAWPELRRYAPRETAALERFPSSQLPGAESFIYWARETFGFKPMLSAYHVVIHPSFGGPGRVLVLSQQFYASRYFDTSLTVSVAAEDPDAPAGGECYVAHATRSRVDSLRGFLGRFKRTQVTGELESSMLKILERYRTVLESDR